MLVLVLFALTCTTTLGSDWIPFAKENNGNNKVTINGVQANVHSVKMPCNGGWFKLYYNTGHFEIFANNRGNLFCKNAGRKNWYGGERYDFNFAKQNCVDGFVQFNVVKTPQDFAVFVNNKQIYKKSFGSSSGDCLMNINKVTTYVYDSRPMTFYLQVSGWTPFAKANNNQNKVTKTDLHNNVHSVKMPCDGGWFKLYYNTGHFEVFANNRGNLFCKNAGRKNWYGGEKYDFNFAKQNCVDGFVQFDIVKSSGDFAVYVQGKQIYKKTFDASSGDCLKDISQITTYVYDSRPMTFFLRKTNWIPFQKANNNNNKVSFSGSSYNVHSVKMPCDGGWFKLYYNTGHFEIFANNRGNLFCKNAGRKNWYGGEKYDFNFAKQNCVDGYVKFDVVKTPVDFTVFVHGKEIFSKAFGSSSGECLKGINAVTTYVYDSRPMTFFLGLY